MNGGLLPLNGLTAADVPEDITPGAAKPVCCDDEGWVPGFGYAGGGFGPYKRCTGCGEVFAKTSARGR